jgi:hypothetical protein
MESAEFTHEIGGFSPRSRSRVLYQSRLAGIDANPYSKTATVKILPNFREL